MMEPHNPDPAFVVRFRKISVLVEVFESERVGRLTVLAEIYGLGRPIRW